MNVFKNKQIIKLYAKIYAVGAIIDILPALEYLQNYMVPYFPIQVRLHQIWHLPQEHFDKSTYHQLKLHFGLLEWLTINLAMYPSLIS